MQGKKQIQLKILLIGDSGCGKTSIMQRYTENKFQIDTKTTIGVEYRKKTINLNGCDVNLLIWDTAGQERFRALTPSYYKGAIGAIIVYDITNYKSFEHIKNIWLEQITNYASKEIQIQIVGNKCDKEHERAISTQNVQKFCQENEYSFFETSAKDGINIDETFQKFAENLKRKVALNLMTQIKMRQSNQFDQQQQNGETIQIKSDKNKEKKKKCC